MLKPDKPKWIRPDGTDERLVNPIEHFVRAFRHYPGDDKNPKRDKASQIERDHPEFVQSLLTEENGIDTLGLFNKLSRNDPITPEEECQHTAHVRSRLELTREFATNEFGSVEEFMKWWKE